MSPSTLIGLLFLALILGIYLFSVSIFILREYERGVVFRLGRLMPVKGPGLVIIIPIVDRFIRVSLRIVTIEVPSQDVITEDNVSVQVNAVVYFRVFAPDLAITQIEDYHFRHITDISNNLKECFRTRAILMSFFQKEMN